MLKVDEGVWLFGLRVNTKTKWAAIFLGRYGFVLRGTGEDKNEKRT